MRQLSLAKTLQWHQSLAEQFPTNKEKFADLLHTACGELRTKGITFGGKRDMTVALSALFLDESDVAALNDITTQLHRITETVLDRTTATDDNLTRYFPHHKRIFPFLNKTPGCPTRQIVSRFDAVVTPTGQVKIIELNTCCPAGFLHSESFCEVTQTALETGQIAMPSPTPRYGAINPSALVQTLLEIEAQSGLEKNLIGVLIDENQIMHELNLLLDEIARQGRQAQIIDARELSFRNDKLRHKGRLLSVVFNKFRVSVPTSRNHYWKEGFEIRYKSLLGAIQAGRVAAVNNFYGMSLGEDKAFLAMLRDPTIQAELSEEDRTFIEDHVCWTVRLADQQVTWQDRTVDLMELLRTHKDQFVIKPANEGRGFEVRIGKYCTDDEWKQVCRIDVNTPCVVQEYIDPVQLPVVTNGSEKIHVQPMFLTLGLASLRGQYVGTLSRISAVPVTNVAQKGMVQAIFY